jgi:hypothetical protein
MQHYVVCRILGHLKEPDFRDALPAVHLYQIRSGSEIRPSSTVPEPPHAVAGRRQ